MTKVPEIKGDVWLNSGPLGKQDLAGKVVLIDFWTYTCMDCLRSIPYLERWWRKYGGPGFVLLGVHTPEFEFEKDAGVVEEALLELGVGWPVVLDNELANSGDFDFPALPATYLVNREGRIVYTHFGEGNYGRTEENIRQLLGEKGVRESSSVLELEEHIHGGMCFRPTPKLYCGYAKGSLENPGGYAPDREADYVLPAELEDDSMALAGGFTARTEYLEASGPGAAIHVSFHATEVNLVLLAPHGRAAAKVAYGGEPLVQEDIRGEDVDESGVVSITRPRMYNLLSCEEPVLGTLSVESQEGAFRAYVFTFSGCVD